MMKNQAHGGKLNSPVLHQFADGAIAAKWEIKTRDKKICMHRSFSSRRGSQ